MSMTPDIDTSVLQPPVPVPVPDDFKSEFACEVPGCGRSFPSRNGLQGHMIAHRPPVHCPECGAEYKTPGALGNHRKQMHGVLGPWAENKPIAVEKEAKKRGRPVGSTNKPKPVSKAQARIDWTPDEIFESVVRSLWPEGSVPVRCLTSLWEWREATREFLEKVQSE